MATAGQNIKAQILLSQLLLDPFPQLILTPLKKIWNNHMVSVERFSVPIVCHNYYYFVEISEYYKIN